MNRTAAEKLGIKAFDAAEYLQSDEDCAAYLQACLEQTPDDAAVFAKALGDIARARGMMQLAKDTGLTREGLYKALGNLCHGGVEITKLGNLNRPALPRACHLIAVTLRYT